MSYFTCFSQNVKTPDDYEKQYLEKLQEERYSVQNLTEFILAGTEFDAIWAMALGLDAASGKVLMSDDTGCEHLPGDLVRLEEFDYQNEKMGCVLSNSFQQVNFSGITVSQHVTMHVSVESL